MKPTKWMCADCKCHVLAYERPSRCVLCNGKMLSWSDRITAQRKAAMADRLWAEATQKDN